MKLKIDYKKTDKLVPYAMNARTHSEHQVQQIARSIQEFGFNNPVLIDTDGTIIAGHGRVMAAKALGYTEVPCVILGHLSERQRKAYILADNKIALNSGWDLEKLAREMNDLVELDFDVAAIGFDEQELEALLKDEASILPPGFAEPDRVEVGAHTRVINRTGHTEDDTIPEVATQIVTRMGDVWLLGDHRLMCGDSTSQNDVATLMAGRVASLIHADPPYGMGKEASGVANDNIYREKLDAFQLSWWSAFRPHLAGNASAYIWGNAPDLWRLWYSAGFGSSEELRLCNEVVWDKKSSPGMLWDGANQYMTATERCLFFQLGDQYMGNLNQDQYFEGFEPVRSYLEAEAAAAKLTPSKLKELTGVGMYSHWFTRSQWVVIPERHYRTLADAFPGNFTRPWSELKAEQEKAQKQLLEFFGSVRSYFDNTHDIMRDVWEFPRVSGDERFGHATPKPVAMIERAVRSSSREGDSVAEPFGGSGPTLIACEKAGRRAHVMELVPSWCDVIVKRWQDFTDRQAVHEATGKTFNQLAAERE